MIEIKPSIDLEAPKTADSSYLLDDVLPSQRVWFAIDGGKIVGGIRLNLESGATGKDAIGPNVVIGDVSIESNQRRRGYGRELMKFVEEWVSDNKDLPHTLSLAVETDNVPAIRLYQSLGYQTLTVNGRKKLINGATTGKECLIMFKKLQ